MAVLLTFDMFFCFNVSMLCWTVLCCGGHGPVGVQPERLRMISLSLYGSCYLPLHWVQGCLTAGISCLSKP